MTIQRLLRLPARDLRAIASRLGVRSASHSRKPEWAQAILAAWDDPSRRERTLAMLSPEAHRALSDLMIPGGMPATLFLQTYGRLRTASNRSTQSRPWRNPASPAEELYYVGLLVPVDDAPVHRATRLTTLLSIPPQQTPPAPAPPHADPRPLLHDLAQLLAFFHQRPHQRLIAHRWLPPRPLRDLDRRLVDPEPLPDRPSHKRCPRLAFLMALAAAAGWIDEGMLSPTGWEWLRRPAPERMRQAWEAWIDPPHPAATYYAATLMTPRSPLLEAILQTLRISPDPFSARSLAHRALAGTPNLDAFALAHYGSLSRFIDDLTHTLASPLTALGVVSTVRSEPPTWMVTDLGRWLLDPDTHAPPADLGDDVRPADLEEDDVKRQWRVWIPMGAPPHLWVPLVAFADYEGQAIRGDMLGQVWRIDRGAVGLGIARGLAVDDLLRTLRRLGLPDLPSMRAALLDWQAQASQLTLAVVPLLRAADRHTMAEIACWPPARRFIAEILSPTAAIVDGPPERVANLLRSKGLWIIPEPGEPPAALGSSVTLWPASARALSYLAVRLYASLSAHIDLPIPPDAAAARALLETLSEEERAVVNAQWLRLERALAELLDGYTGAASPAPADPDQWRRQIESAIERGERVRVVYLTAGRNVITERVLEPYWIEERQGVAYVRAYCHQAERVLIFRLDRFLSVRPDDEATP
ncbi:MAG: hypothetical protein Kow0047_32860 [Anaerolineae bacterium]